MFKTILKILFAIVILGALSFGVFWYLDRGQGGSGVPSIGNISIGDLFPFGNSGDTGTTPTPNTGTPNTTPDTTPTGDQTFAPAPRLWRISSDAQSGAGTFVSSSTPFVRFVDRATGNIFESELGNTGTQRISNTTIPKVYSALWLPNGNSVVMRYLDENNRTIKTTLGTIASSTRVISTPGGDSPLATVRELLTSFLPNNITDISVNKAGSMAFVVKNQNTAQIFVANSTGANPRNVFESAIKDRSVKWVDNTTLALGTKPSASAVGSLYFLKTDSLALTRVVGNKAGLVALPNNGGTKIFYAESANGTFTSSIIDPKTGVETKPAFNTTPDKCVWASQTAYIYCAVPRSIPTGAYPDVWYQGKVSFVDDLWRHDTSSGATEFLIDPDMLIENGLDATDLVLDPTENYIVFTNKKDQSLWGLRIAK